MLVLTFQRVNNDFSSFLNRIFQWYHCVIPISSPPTETAQTCRINDLKTVSVCVLKCFCVMLTFLLSITPPMQVFGQGARLVGDLINILGLRPSYRCTLLLLKGYIIKQYPRFNSIKKPKLNYFWQLYRANVFISSTYKPPMLFF